MLLLGEAIVNRGIASVRLAQTGVRDAIVNRGIASVSADRGDAVSVNRGIVSVSSADRVLQLV